MVNSPCRCPGDAAGLVEAAQLGTLGRLVERAATPTLKDESEVIPSEEE